MHVSIAAFILSISRTTYVQLEGTWCDCETAGFRVFHATRRRSTSVKTILGGPRSEQQAIPDVTATCQPAAVELKPTGEEERCRTSSLAPALNKDERMFEEVPEVADGLKSEVEREPVGRVRTRVGQKLRNKSPWSEQVWIDSCCRWLTRFCRPLKFGGSS
ncbi:hypothetical protein B0H12DRAFT_1067380 [Mycena haematopus]|nr:hypothetical protein B0H12DRAFT_1067380 [Mycena haematopus]